MIRRISNSSLSEWTRCRRSWHLTQQVGVRRSDVPRPLSVGDLFHVGVAAYNEALAAFPDAPLDEAVRTAKTWARAAIATRHDECCDWLTMCECTADEYQKAVYDVGEHRKTAIGMCERYADRWAREDRDDWEVVATELRFEVKVNAPGKRALHAARFVGALDRVARRRITGALWVIETKSSGARSVANYAETVHVGDQPIGYVYAARKLFKEPVSLLFDAARSKVPSEPAILKSNGMVSAAACDTTPAVMLAAIERAADDAVPPHVLREAIRRIGETPGAEKFAALLGNLRASWLRGDWFSRVPYAVTDEDVDRWAETFCANAAGYGRGPYTPNTLSGCNTAFGKCRHYGWCFGNKGFTPDPSDPPDGYFVKTPEHKADWPVELRK